MQDHEVAIIQSVYPRNTLIDTYLDEARRPDLKDTAQNVFRFYIFSDFLLQAVSSS